MNNKLSARARLAARTRHLPADSPAIIDARRELATESLAEYIASKIANAPPLTAEQVERLRGLLPAPSDADGVRDAS